jgi:hypothetical protein
VLKHLKNTLISTTDRDLFLLSATASQIHDLVSKFPRVQIISRANTTAKTITELLNFFHPEDQVDVYVIADPVDSMLIKLAYNN